MTRSILPAFLRSEKASDRLWSEPKRSLRPVPPRPRMDRVDVSEAVSLVELAREVER